MTGLSGTIRAMYADYGRRIDYCRKSGFLVFEGFLLRRSVLVRARLFLLEFDRLTCYARQ